MKIRNGFVSNSSSSSFTCDVCGETMSGWDQGLSEFDMFECVNGHTCCNSHRLSGDIKEYSDSEKIEILKKWFKEEDVADQNPENLVEDLEDYWEEYKEFLEDNAEDIGSYDVEEKYCPCCNFTELANSDAFAFYVITTGKTFQDVCKEIKENCKSYAEFQKKYVKED